MQPPAISSKVKLIFSFCYTSVKL